jgi:propanol-preferring alcohol dehydrogenase
LYSTCGRCEYCAQGSENLCDQARFTGLHADGGYAEYMVVSEDFAYQLPEGFADLQAAPLLCAGIIGYRALLLSDAELGGRLGLYGFGASAHVTIQVARYQGCEVYVFSRGEEHRKHAEELGAVWTGRAEDTPPKPLDSAIIFAPAGGLVPEALRVLRKGGTLALAGIHMSPIPQMEYNLIYGERTVRSVANSTREDARSLLDLAAEIPIRTDVETFPLSEANHMLERLKRADIRGAAVLEVASS